MEEIILVSVSEKGAEAIRRVKTMEGSSHQEKFIFNRMYQFFEKQDPYILIIRPTGKMKRVAQMVRFEDFERNLVEQLSEYGVEKDVDYKVMGR